VRTLTPNQMRRLVLRLVPRIDANFVAHFVAKSSHTSSAAYAAN